MESLNPEEQQDDSVQSAIDSSVIESLRSGPRSPPLFSSSPTAVHATINNTMNAAAMSDNRPSVRSSVGSDGGGGSLSESPHKLQHPSSQQSLQSAGDDGRRMGPRYAAASELSQWSETSSYGIRENRRCRQQNQFSQQQQQQQYGSTMTYASKIGAQDNFSFLLNGDEMLPTHSQQSQCMLMHAQQRHPHTNASSLQSSLDDDGAPCNSLRDHEQNADDLTDAMLLSGLMNEQLDGDDIDEIVAAAGDLTDVMLLNGLMDHQLDGDDVDEMVAAVETSPAVSFYHASFNNNSNSGASGGSNSQQHQQQQEQEYVLGSEGITGGSPANGSIAGRRPGRGFESLSVADALPKDLFDLTDSANASLEHLDLCNDDCSAPEISEADVIADGQPCAAALPRVFDSDLAEPPGSVATESAQPVVSFANSAADPDISKVALRNILDTVFTSQYGDYSDDIQATRIIGLIQATPRNTVNSGLVPLQPASSSSGVNVNVVNQPQINYSAAQAAMQIFWQGINTPPTSQSSTSSSSSPSSSSSSSLPSSSLPSASLPSASLPSSSSSSASSSLTSSSLPSSSSSTTWILDNGVGIPGLENGTVVVVANPGTDFAAESAETREDTEIIDLTYDTDDEDLAFCKKPEVKVEEADRSELHINNDDDDNDVSETCRGRRRKRRQILDSSGRGGGSPQAPGSQAGRGKPGPGPLGRSNGGNGQDDMPAAFGGRAIGGTDKPGNNGDRQNERLAGSAMKAAGLSGARGQDCFPRALRLRTPGGPGKQGTARTIQHQSNKERSVGPSRPAGSATAGHPGGTIASEDVKSSANKDKGVGPCSGRRPRDSGASRTRRRRSPSPPSSSGRHSPSRPQRRISGTQKRPQESKASRGAAFGQPRPGEARCNASPAAKHAGPDDAPGASGAKRARTKPVSRDHALNIAGKSVTQTSHSSEPIVGGKISILQNLTKRIITSAKANAAVRTGRTSKLEPRRLLKVAFSRSQAAVSQADAESFSCGICQKRFGGKAKLTIHIRRHTGVKPYVCQHCAKAFVSWGELADHKELKHAVGQPYQCSRCHKKFKAKSLLRAHARVHSDARPFRCAVPECTSAFKASSALHAHTATVHKGERNFPCELCESRFKTKAVLSAHVVQTHTSERPFKCGLCPQAFKAKSTLKEHVQTRHGDARPYPCTRCARAFKTRSALHCHTATVHSEDRPFPCDQCKAAFKTKAARNEHAIMKHSTKRPLKCPLCRQKFKTLGTLNGHMLCHSEERPFGCNLCASAFKRTSELNRHTATIHSSEDRPFACEECPATFKRKAELNKHVIRKHTTD